MNPLRKKQIDHIIGQHMKPYIGGLYFTVKNMATQLDRMESPLYDLEQTLKVLIQKAVVAKLGEPANLDHFAIYLAEKEYSSGGHICHVPASYFSN